jgi:hypothetical protein
MSPRSLPPPSPRPAPADVFAAIGAALDEHASLWRSWAVIADRIAAEIDRELIVRTAAHTADADRAERLADALPGPDDDAPTPADWYAGLTHTERSTVREALARRLEGLLDDLRETHGAVVALGLGMEGESPAVAAAAPAPGRPN